MKRLAMCLAIAATVVLAGCSSSETGTAPSTVTTSTPAVTASPCPATQLAASLGQSSGTAGTIYHPLSLRNTGSSTCTIQGYAGVSFVAGTDNHRVGQAAGQDTGSTPTVTLSPGQMASATLGIVDAGNFPDDCERTPVSGLQVSPPGQTASLLIAHADTACANPKYSTLHVGPFESA
jgi:Protein of unknown function (DUF4232)